MEYPTFAAGVFVFLFSWLQPVLATQRASRSQLAQSITLVTSVESVSAL
jgi:hypothetical protein